MNLPSHDLGKAKRKITPESARGHVLVVEDEQDLQDLLKFNLEREGYRVSSALSGEKALLLARSDMPDLVILDLMLPGMDGLEVCRGLKADPAIAAVPILMLTAKSEEVDVVTGLELGADDYLTKPFSPRVLMARIRAVLRRHRQQENSENTAGKEAAVQVRDLVIRPDRHEVTIAGKPVELTATEFRMLQLLASRPGRVFTRQQIIDEVHGKFSAVTDRSVDVQIVMLRRKMGETGQDIQTVRGVGYRYRD